MNLRNGLAGIVTALPDDPDPQPGGPRRAATDLPFHLDWQRAAFVAKEKGLFAAEGVEVELVNIEDPRPHLRHFSSVRSMRSSAMPDAPTFAQPDEEPLACVLALDEFAGGDGILATKEVQTVADLKGKSVAVPRAHIRTST